MKLSLQLPIAWTISALVFAVALTLFTSAMVKFEGHPILLTETVRVGMVGIVIGFILQMLYGSLLYFLLSRYVLFTWWAVILGYLVPVLLFSTIASNTTNDVLSTIPWLVYSLLLGVSFWAVMKVN